MSDELLEGLLRVEEYNNQFRQPNPNGRYPICKPTLGNVAYCQRCGWPIIPQMEDRPPCPAVPREQRWGEDWPIALTSHHTRPER